MVIAMLLRGYVVENRLGAPCRYVSMIVKATDKFVSTIKLY